MAIIIRETRMIDGKAEKVKVFKTKRLLTGELREQAERLDEFLSNKVSEIEKEMESTGFLKLKGKKGEVIKLWYEVGKRLDFVTDTSMVAAEDREFVWRAIYDYAGALAPGPLTERVRRDPETSHFSYCYKLSRFLWEFVQMAGDWTSWSEFFDRKETKNDPRIIEWLGKKAKESNVSARQNWLRPLTKAIHKEFENRDTTVFSVEELYERLDKIFAEMRENEQE
ncbi:hypothetical protein CVT91_09050 [Candidatus Atribacteria bacterium HGW-Atribacteria-1]|nr:MAG: hypothetical protein CVT91_09050 [Candidatus Atribacteria bacterium HGW-Atribacteria-1]